MGGRVVVVEDDGDIRELVVQLLADVGFEAVGFADGAAALGALRRAPRVPAVILLDLEMPGMSGWEFRREQRGDPLLAHLPVVVASGADPEVLEREEASGALEADAYLSKPYGLAELVQVLARLSLRAEAAAPLPSSAA